MLNLLPKDSDPIVGRQKGAWGIMKAVSQRKRYFDSARKSKDSWAEKENKQTPIQEAIDPADKLIQFTQYIEII